jgi:glycerophosphoryl diester phosphodiesterase
VSSFSEPVLADVARLRSAVETTFLFERPMRIATVAHTIGPRHDVATRDLVFAAHAAGLRIVPWTVNDVRRMAELVDLGVDGLVTDEPALAREVAASRFSLAA